VPDPVIVIFELSSAKADAIPPGVMTPEALILAMSQRIVMDSAASATPLLNNNVSTATSLRGQRASVLRFWDKNLFSIVIALLLSASAVDF
jgi:hypothetical protein